MSQKVNQLITQLDAYRKRPWYLPLMGLLAALDLFVGVIPTDALVITTTMLKPKRWLACFWVFSLSSAAGSVVLAVTVRLLGMHHFVDQMGSETWGDVHSWIDEYGPAGLAFMAFGPLPQQPAVVACALANMPFPVIFAMVWLGRALKYGGFIWLALKAPHYLKRLPFIQKEREELEASRK